MSSNDSPPRVRQRIEESVVERLHHMQSRQVLLERNLLLADLRDLVLLPISQMLLENQWEYLYNCACPAFPRLVRKFYGNMIIIQEDDRGLIMKTVVEDSRYRLIHSLSVLWSECLCYQSPEFFFLMRLLALISCMTSLGWDLSERTSHTPRSTSVPLLLCTVS